MRVKSWEKFQHYKNRGGSPGWIKLYRKLLDDPEWFKLSGDDAKTLIGIWLVASDNGGELPDTTDELAFKLRANVINVGSSILRLSHWLETGPRDDIEPVYTESMPEEKRIEEKRREEKEGKGASPLPHDEAKVAFTFYNETARELGLPVAISLTPTRRTKLKARLHEHGLGNWFNAVNNIRRQPFLQGKNNRGWVMDLDFLLQEKSFSKVLEGAYIGKKFSRFVEEASELIERSKAKDRANEQGTGCKIVYLEPPNGSEARIEKPDGSTASERRDCFSLCASPPGVDEP